jgi:hypothetical protein
MFSSKFLSAVVLATLTALLTGFGGTRSSATAEDKKSTSKDEKKDEPKKDEKKDEPKKDAAELKTRLKKFED